MPIVFAAVPVAALLAWLATRVGGPKRSARTPMTAGAGLEGGDTGQLRGSRREDDPWKRDELPYASGGEVGGPYGPESNAEAPSAITGYEAPPGPTQTSVLAGPSSSSWAFGSSSPAQVFGGPAPVYHPPPSSPAPTYQAPAVNAPTPVYHGGSVPRPAAAPAPMPAGRYE